MRYEPQAMVRRHRVGILWTETRVRDLVGRFLVLS
jgi:hypothetical protein